jgi:hypothetical protein
VLTRNQRDGIAIGVIVVAAIAVVGNLRMLPLAAVLIAGTVVFMSSVRKEEREAEYQRAMQVWREQQNPALAMHRQPSPPPRPGRNAWSTFGIALACVAAVASLALLALIVLFVVAFANYGSNKG